jgi:hypothetical protein
MATTTTTPTTSQEQRPSPLVGNWLVLAGTIIYLLEFAGFAIAGVGSLYNEPGTTTKAILSSYQGDVAGFGLLVGFLGIVDFGRVAMIVGIRSALQDSGRRSPLMDIAVVAMGVSVVIEIASVAMGAAAAALADGGQSSAVLALDRAAWFFNTALYAPVAVSMALTLVAMWASRLFPKALCVLGSVAAALLVGAALLTDPGRSGLQDTLSLGIELMWVWGIWAGVLLVRRRPGR